MLLNIEPDGPVPMLSPRADTNDMPGPRRLAPEDP
jgi:hypothetical protein